MRLSSLVILGSLAFGSACGGSSAPTPPSSSPVSQTAAAGTYDVHEWGLVRMSRTADVMEATTFAPPARESFPAIADKPVLYFHASGAMRLEHVRVIPTVGTALEHWPFTSSAPERLEWSGLALEPGRSSCAGRFPTLTDPPCNTIGPECESAQLASIVATDSTCLSGAHGTAPFLFYRSIARFTPPITIARAGADLRVTNGGSAAIPGRLIRLSNASGTIRAAVIPGPGAGETVSVRAPTDANADDGRTAVRVTMRELGMTEPEIDAFMRAWEEALFGAASDGTRVFDRISASDETTMDDLRAAPSDSLFYFLPAAACDDISRLEMSPPPRQLRRAIAVWVGVDGQRQ